ncbi:hypothetical protein C8R44DRAFT_859075 [Mycena epipterygia]|nr:hypothetical protein C8R44DRAFT_859075 [Mycena epipterygia]
MSAMILWMIRSSPRSLNAKPYEVRVNGDAEKQPVEGKLLVRPTRTGDVPALLVSGSAGMGDGRVRGEPGRGVNQSRKRLQRARGTRTPKALVTTALALESEGAEEYLAHGERRRESWVGSGGTEDCHGPEERKCMANKRFVNARCATCIATILRLEPGVSAAQRRERVRRIDRRAVCGGCHSVRWLGMGFGEGVEGKCDAGRMRVHLSRNQDWMM